MDLLWDGLRRAFELVVGFDGTLLEIVGRSAMVSATATATAIAMAIGIPAGTALGLLRFRGRRLVAVVVYTGMALPTVAVGLVVALFL
jgi:tungstate transport system permease protein